MQQYFVDNKSDELIIFFCGWAMDEKPFRIAEPKDKDVLYLYDYSDLSIDFDFSKYKKKVLIAFSYGVFISGLVQALFCDCDLKIAINGTFKPIDKRFGIPEKIFDLTLHSMSHNTMNEFHKKMFDNSLDYEYFEEHLPCRGVEGCAFELEKIREYVHLNPNVCFDLDKIFVSKNDRIVSSKNQLGFWEDSEQTCGKIKTIDAGHFLFYKFTDLNEIINL